MKFKFKSTVADVHNVQYPKNANMFRSVLLAALCTKSVEALIESGVTSVLMVMKHCPVHLLLFWCENCFGQRETEGESVCHTPEA